jgi:zinc transport system substrate-binding protein
LLRIVLMTITCRPRPGALLAGGVAALLAVGGCSAPGGGADGGDRLAVLASFYPLQFVAERVGGDDVAVTSLTPAGAEPHDLELSPAQVRAVGAADVVVTLSGFQPAVDEAIAARSPEHLVDAAPAADREGDAGHAEDEEGPAEDEHADEAGSDPHFWLDPTRLAGVGTAVAAALADARPERAEDFAARAAELSGDLAALDEDVAAGLATCEDRVIVTTHEAFGYLADRYDLEQVGISGLDPEGEPTPARLREVAATVEDRGVTTIFTESLVNPKVAEVLAADLGVSTALLDPLEGLSDPDADYLSVMRDNLAALRAALRCD